MHKYVLVATLLLGFALCQDDGNDLNIDDLKDKIPGLENFNQSALPTKEEAEKLFREKCEKNGGPTAYDDIVNSKDHIKTCFEQYVNTTVIMEELDEAKKDGSMDEVFGKYCKKKSEILTCVKDVVTKIEKCMEPSEKDNMKIVMNVTENLVDFVCYKDGDRLAMFVAQGGFECLQDKKTKLQECANSTLKNGLPSDLSINNLPKFVIGDKECSDMFELQTCVVSELEKCTDNTPANIVEALFKFIKKATPCKTFDPRKMEARDPRKLEEVIQVMDKVKRSQQVQFSFIDSFSGKCLKYAGPKAYGDLESSVNDLKGCVQNHLKLTDACERLPTEVRNCTNKVINKLRVCLPPQESYLPSFAHSSVDAVLHYICDNKGKNLNRFIYSGGLNCLFSNDPKPLNDCLAGTKTRRTSDNIITKVELCEDLNKVQLCLSTYITNHCAEIKDFKEVSMGIFDAFKTPCSGCSLFISNSLIFISLFALRKFL